MITARYLVDRSLAVRTLCNARVHIMDEELCTARNLASSFVHRITTLEAGLKATRADSPALTTAPWPSDSVFTSRSGAPLQRLRFTDADVLLDHIVLFLDLGGAKLLDLLQRVVLFTPLLHAG